MFVQGGQSISAWDYDLAPYVNKSFVKAVKETVSEWCQFQDVAAHTKKFSELDSMTYGMDEEEASKLIRSVITGGWERAAIASDAGHIYRIASEKTKDETHQAMEAAIHNYNSLHSRAGQMWARFCRNAE